MHIYFNLVKKKIQYRHILNLKLTKTQNLQKTKTLTKIHMENINIHFYKNYQNNPKK